MMKKVTNYKEFNDNIEAPSILVAISKNEITNKKSILNYMKSFKEDIICPVRIFDYIAGKTTNITLIYYTDGEFIWDERDIYHFEKYNLILNEEFIRKALKYR